MSPTATIDAYGTLTEPATLRMERLLPGPVERVWAFLTESDKRKLWLASGVMTLSVGAPFELVWRNDELGARSSERPEGFSEEQRMESRITDIEPLHRLSFAWPPRGEVTIELAPQGKDVLLTLTHRRISDRANMTKVGAGWHTHLDLLADRLWDKPTSHAFWPEWKRLHAEYDSRLPA